LPALQLHQLEARFPDFEDLIRTKYVDYIFALKILSVVNLEPTITETALKWRNASSENINFKNYRHFVHLYFLVAFRRVTLRSLCFTMMLGVRIRLAVNKRSTDRGSVAVSLSWFGHIQ